jgi:hypothetical protein
MSAEGGEDALLDVPRLPKIFFEIVFHRRLHREKDLKSSQHRPATNIQHEPTYEIENNIWYINHDNSFQRILEFVKSCIVIVINIQILNSKFANHLSRETAWGRLRRTLHNCGK